MAKDKSKKTKDSDDFAKPSEAKGGGDGWRLEDDANIGKLFLISPLRVKDDAKGFEDQISEVIVADIVAINEKKPEKSEEHEGAWVWGGWTKGALRGYVGKRKVLARLEQDKSKGRGKNAAWVLVDADKDDIEMAKAYLASIDPFKQKGDSSDDDEKPSKSKKDKGGKDEKPAKGKPEKKAKGDEKPAKKKSKK